MRRLLMILAPVLALGGCALPPSAVEPERLVLGSDTLRLHLTDGTICKTRWAADAAGMARGTLTGCGPGYDYVIQVEQNPNVIRQLTSGLLMALGAEALVSPMAQVTVTGPGDGPWIFTAPNRGED